MATQKKEKKAVKAGATPTPWKTVKSLHGKDYLVVQVGKDSMYTTGDLKPHDARLIVKAVNNFAPLVEACERALAVIQEGAEGSAVEDHLRGVLKKAGKK